MPSNTKMCSPQESATDRPRPKLPFRRVARRVTKANSRHARFSGPALGKAAFRTQLEALDKRFVYQAYTPIETIAEGDKVAVRAVIRMTQRDGGREFLMQVADFWTVRDGKLAALVEYYDTALAAQVV